MKYQNTFKRYEIKYMISAEQKEILLSAMSPYMRLDKYGRTTIRNIYFDTDNFRLSRRSIEKPVYKEKLRVRSYGLATPDSKVFVELKKKYKSVVYNLVGLGTRRKTAQQKMLRVTIPEDLDYTDVFEPILAEYTSEYEFAQVKTTNMGSLFRLTYNVTVKDIKKEKEFIDKLRVRNGNLEITLSMQETTGTEL